MMKFTPAVFIITIVLAFSSFGYPTPSGIIQGFQIDMQYSGGATPKIKVNGVTYSFNQDFNEATSLKILSVCVAFAQSNGFNVALGLSGGVVSDIYFIINNSSNLKSFRLNEADSRVVPVIEIAGIFYEFHPSHYENEKNFKSLVSQILNAISSNANVSFNPWGSDLVGDLIISYE